MVPHMRIPVSIGSEVSYANACAEIFTNVPTDEQLFAVIDPCAIPEIDGMLQDAFVDFLVLAPGFSPNNLVSALPRVFPINKGDTVLTRIIESFGQGTGILLSCKKSWDITTITAHLGGLCYAVETSGKKVWLRFYDPYVMNAIVNMLPHSLSDHFFGKHITTFIIEDFIDSQYNIYVRKDDHSHDEEIKNIYLTPEFTEYLDDQHYTLFLTHIFIYYFSEISVNLTDSQKNEVKLLIKRHVSSAEELGFQSMEHIFRFLKLAFRYGWDFYATPPFAKILGQPFSSPEQKLKALEAFQMESVSPCA